MRGGNGERLLIAFHGYGDSAALFRPLMERWGDKWVVYAVDLPLHGASGEGEIRKEVFISLIQQILKKEQKDQCSLLGFSFGGRLVLSILPMISQKIQDVILLAPEGIEVQGIYKKALRLPSQMKKVVFPWFVNRYAVKNTRFLYKKKIVHRYLCRFMELNANTVEKRKRMLIYWLAETEVKVNWAEVVRIIKIYNIPIQVYLGTKDEVIPVATGEKMMKNTSLVQVVYLPANHRKVFREFMKKIDFPQ